MPQTFTRFKSFHGVPRRVRHCDELPSLGLPYNTLIRFKRLCYMLKFTKGMLIRYNTLCTYYDQHLVKESHV